MPDLLARPWPWWVAGPLLGLIVPALLLYGGKPFGVSSSLRHACASVCGGRPKYFDYGWWRVGAWNLAFVLGLVVGGALATTLFSAEDARPVAVSAATWEDLAELGIEEQPGLAPRELFAWDRLGTLAGAVSVVVGGFLLGFGARWAGGCTSGHAITGLADRQLPSLVAVLGFLAGGLVISHLVLPRLLAGAAAP